MTPFDILYIDDDADIRVIVAMSLRLDPAITVRIARSGREGLEMLATGPRPDVVLLDVMMPGLDGPKVLDLIRADPTTATLPVIFITAKARPNDVASYRARGANDVILKPFDPIHLAADVRAIMDDIASQ